MELPWLACLTRAVPRFCVTSCLIMTRQSLAGLNSLVRSYSARQTSMNSPGVPRRRIHIMVQQGIHTTNRGFREVPAGGQGLLWLARWFRLRWGRTLEGLSEYLLRFVVYSGSGRPSAESAGMASCHLDIHSTPSDRWREIPSMPVSCFK